MASKLPVHPLIQLKEGIMGGERKFSTIRTLIDRNAMLYPDRVGDERGRRAW